MKLFAKAKNNNGQLGAGLIEVLVAMLILAIGLLGILSLQANGLGSNQRADFVGKGQVLALDMADRILAYGTIDALPPNNTYRGALNGEYGGTDTDSAVVNPNCQAPGGPGCNPLNTVAYDRAEWQRLFNVAQLPSGRGTVEWAAPVYTITVRWDQDRTGASGTDCDSNDKSATGNLSCFVMEVRP